MLLRLNQSDRVAFFYSPRVINASPPFRDFEAFMVNMSLNAHVDDAVESRVSCTKVHSFKMFQGNVLV